MTNASSPERMIVHVVCHAADVATRTSAWTATTLTWSRPGPRLDPEELGRLREVLDLFGGLLLTRLELLARAVDPDDRDLLLDARLDVVVVARRHVHPALLAADAA